MCASAHAIGLMFEHKRALARCTMWRGQLCGRSFGVSSPPAGEVSFTTVMACIAALHRRCPEAPG